MWFVVCGWFACLFAWCLSVPGALWDLRIYLYLVCVSWYVVLVYASMGIWSYMVDCYMGVCGALWRFVVAWVYGGMAIVWGYCRTRSKGKNFFKKFPKKLDKV